MTKQNDRPVLKDRAYFCNLCGSKDTVSLVLDKNYILWCECGEVVISTTSGEEEKTVTNFIEPSKSYFVKKD